MPKCSLPVLQLNRRQWLLQTAAAAGGLALTGERAYGAESRGLTRGAEAIHQEVTFKATPKRVYEVLTDAAQFQQVVLLGVAAKSLDVTSHPAVIGREAGNAFSLFAEFISGRHIELVPHQRIVQAWREASWGPGIYSLVRFELMEQDAGTKLIFDHTGFPAGAGDHLATGWYSNYWEPLKKFLA